MSQRICRFNNEICSDTCPLYQVLTDMETNKKISICTFFELNHLHNIENLLREAVQLLKQLLEQRE